MAKLEKLLTDELDGWEGLIFEMEAERRGGATNGYGGLLVHSTLEFRCFL
jgi:hypothetical protein